MDKHQNFAKNLSAIQKIKECSLVEFSKEIGVPKSTLQSVLEDGHTTLDTAIRISEGLNIPLDTLLSDDALAQKLDVLHGFIKDLNWFSSLSASNQKEVVFYLNKILEVIGK